MHNDDGVCNIIRLENGFVNVLLDVLNKHVSGMRFTNTFTEEHVSRACLEIMLTERD